MKTVKFGGTSLASAEMMKHCADILKSDDARRYVIVSAPGKRFDGDIKVTDLLYTGEGDQRVLTLTFTALPEGFSEWKRKLLQPV